MNQFRLLADGFSRLPRAFRLLFQAAPGSFLLGSALTALSGLGVVGIGVFFKLMIEHILISKQLDQTVVLYLFLQFLIALTAFACGAFSAALSSVTREQLQNYIRVKVAEQASRMDMEFFEHAENYDEFAKSGPEFAYKPFLMAYGVVGVINGLSTSIGFFVVVYSFQPILALGLFIAALPTLFASGQSGAESYESFDLLTPEGRRASYFDSLLTQDDSVKEIRLFGLANQFLIPLKNYGQTKINVTNRLEIKRARTIVQSGLFNVVFLYAAIAFAATQLALGLVSIGDFVLFFTSATTIRIQLTMVFAELGMIVEHSSFFGNLNKFLDRSPKIIAPENPKQIPEGVLTLECRNLGFHYANSDKWIFRDINLTMKSGESIALVGVNGAGKTTFVKLLSRLYDPVEGQILLNGIDIREFDPVEYRKLVGAILQDFAKYQMTLLENTVIGSSEEHVDQEKLAWAASCSGVDEIVRDSPDGWGTVLGRQFATRGLELSGGQWQRVALARTIYRGSRILFLDEPSSALDAETEAKLFEKYAEISRHSISLLISHRLNTVRGVDKILVLDQGRIVEQGNHDDLMASDGQYARIYNIQAKPFQTVQA